MCELQTRQACTESYSIPPYKRSPSKGRVLLIDVLGRRRPVGFVREFYPIWGGTLPSEMSPPRPTPIAKRGMYCNVHEERFAHLREFEAGWREPSSSSHKQVAVSPWRHRSCPAHTDTGLRRAAINNRASLSSPCTQPGASLFPLSQAFRGGSLSPRTDV
jgi:hypothetical protein